MPPSPSRRCPRRAASSRPRRPAAETAAWPRGIRPDALRRLSVGSEAVVVFEDIAKGNHEFAHAADGEVITAVMTTAPPSWGDTQPDRLRLLAEELGMQHQDGSPPTPNSIWGTSRSFSSSRKPPSGSPSTRPTSATLCSRCRTSPPTRPPGLGQTPRPLLWWAQHICAPMRKPQVVSQDLYDRVVYGSGDDAVLSELFGLMTPYSERAEELRRELVRSK